MSSGLKCTSYLTETAHYVIEECQSSAGTLLRRTAGGCSAVVCRMPVPEPVGAAQHFPSSQQGICPVKANCDAPVNPCLGALQVHHGRLSAVAVREGRTGRCSRSVVQQRAADDSQRANNHLFSSSDSPARLLTGSPASESGMRGYARFAGNAGIF